MQVLLCSVANELSKSLSTALVLWAGTPRCPDCSVQCGTPQVCPDCNCVCKEGSRQVPLDCENCPYPWVGLVCLLVGVVLGAFLQQWVTLRSTVVGVRTFPVQESIVTPPSDAEVPDRFVLRELAQSQIKQLRR